MFVPILGRSKAAIKISRNLQDKGIFTALVKRRGAMHQKGSSTYNPVLSEL